MLLALVSPASEKMVIGLSLSRFHGGQLVKQDLVQRQRVERVSSGMQNEYSMLNHDLLFSFALLRAP